MNFIGDDEMNMEMILIILSDLLWYLETSNVVVAFADKGNIVLRNTGK
jgi:hypothetical protein